jgi:hypothetical protein
MAVLVLNESGHVHLIGSSLPGQGWRSLWQRNFLVGLRYHNYTFGFRHDGYDQGARAQARADRYKPSAAIPTAHAPTTLEHHTYTNRYRSASTARITFLSTDKSYFLSKQVLYRTGKATFRLPDNSCFFSSRLNTHRNSKVSVRTYAE